MKTTGMFLSLSLLLPACGQFDVEEVELVDGGEMDAMDDGADEQSGAGGDGGGQEGGGDGDAGDAGDDGDAGDGGSMRDDGGAGDDGDAGDAGDDGADDGEGDDGADDGDADADGGADGDDHVDEGEDFECEPTVVELIAGQSYDAGQVTISTEADGLNVTVFMYDPWQLELVHIYAGAEPPPNNGSAMIPGLFPFSAPLGGLGIFELTIPFEAIEGAGCGDPLFVAVHAEAFAMSDGELVCEQTAWAEGPYGFDGAWGTYLETSLCCE